MRSLQNYYIMWIYSIRSAHFTFRSITHCAKLIGRKNYNLLKSDFLLNSTSQTQRIIRLCTNTTAKNESDIAKTKEEQLSFGVQEEQIKPELSQELLKISSNTQQIYNNNIKNIDNNNSSILNKDYRNINEEDEDFDEEEIRKKVKEDFIWQAGPPLRKSSSFASFANESKTIEKLVQLGVEIYKWDSMYDPPGFILKLDFEKDIAPYLRFLCDNGIHPSQLGMWITRNPKIFKQSLENLQIRIKYLQSKKFSNDDIATIIYFNPNWLNFSVVDIDKRLGFFQTFFELTGTQIRALVTLGPTLITRSLMNVRNNTFKLKEEMGFDAKEIVQLLLKHPSIFRLVPEALWSRFNYLHNEVGFSHEDILKEPKVLITRESKLRNRIGFLQKIGRAQFNPEEPNYVSFENIINNNDAHFSLEIAKSSPQEFNNYLKSL